MIALEVHNFATDFAMNLSKKRTYCICFFTSIQYHIITKSMLNYLWIFIKCISVYKKYIIPNSHLFILIFQQKVATVSLYSFAKEHQDAICLENNKMKGPKTFTIIYTNKQNMMTTLMTTQALHQIMVQISLNTVIYVMLLLFNLHHHF